METTDLPVICPVCGVAQEAATSLSELQRPKPGSLMLCFDCGSFNFLADDYSLRIPTPEEQQGIDADPEVRRIKRAWGKIKAMRDNAN